jgi:hypothetical protein
MKPAHPLKRHHRDREDCRGNDGRGILGDAGMNPFIEGLTGYSKRICPRLELSDRSSNSRPLLDLLAACAARPSKLPGNAMCSQ